MKKNVTIAVLAVVAALGIETSIFFGVSCDRNYTKLRHVSMTLSEVREENQRLSRENRNLREVVDSIDNPHHHNYLLTLQPYRALQK